MARAVHAHQRSRPTPAGRAPRARARKSLAKLDKYHLLILDDIAYVSKDQAETSVLFELIGSRYERRSMLITANQPFGAWSKVFPDQAMTLAAIDRLVHHSTILDMKGTQTVFARHSLVRRLRGAVQRYTEADFDLPPGDADFVNEEAQEFLTLAEVQPVDGGPDFAGDPFDAGVQPGLLGQLLALVNQRRALRFEGGAAQFQLRTPTQ